MVQKNRDVIHTEVVVACAISLGVSVAAFAFQGAGQVPEFANRQYVERQVGANIALEQDGEEFVYRADYMDSLHKKAGFSVSCKGANGVFVDVFRRFSSGEKGIYGYVYVAREDAQKIVDSQGFCAGAIKAIGRK